MNITANNKLKKENMERNRSKKNYAKQNNPL